MYTNLKIKIPPGIRSDVTPYSSGPHWIDCDKIRFRQGYPEMIGGWEKYTASTLDGVARNAHHWHTINASQYTGIGTNLKYYAETGGSLNNITPLRSAASALGTDPFAATSGSNTITVTHSSHGAIDGDFVTFSGATTFAGIPASNLNKEHQITLIDLNSYTIDVTTSATSTASGGGASVVGDYQLNIGAAYSVSGDGWGAGYWGGGTVRSSSTIDANPFATVNTDATVTVTDTGHGASDGDYVVFTSISASTVGGLPKIWLVNVAFQLTYINANSYSIELGTAATATDAAAGGTVVAKYYSSTSTGWGAAANATVAGADPRIWSADNYGEDLILCPRDGELYYWDVTVGGSAVLISGISGADSVPVIASEVAVSDARHVIAFATNPAGSSDQDKGLIRFSSSEDYLDWNLASTTNSAGELQIPTGSSFVTHIKTRQEILVWTESSLCAMQYVGAPDIYGINTISARTNIVGPNAKATVNDTVYWMGTDNFYMYNGTVVQIPCTVWDKVFNDMNTSFSFAFVCGVNNSHGEIVWFYPSAGEIMNDRYVIYNYMENLWYYGSMSRSCWIDLGLTNQPRGIDEMGNIYVHEVGYSDGSTSPSSAISSYITSSDIELDNGNSYVQVRRIIPDLTFRNTATASPTATITLTPSDWPGAATGTADSMDVSRTSSVTATLEKFDTYKDISFRSRSMSMKVSSNETGVGWRLGDPRVTLRTSGRRA